MTKYNKKLNDDEVASNLSINSQGSSSSKNLEDANASDDCNEIESTIFFKEENASVPLKTASAGYRHVISFWTTITKVDWLESKGRGIKGDE